jgi:hypothetical protein
MTMTTQQKLTKLHFQANQIETFATKIGVTRVANGATFCLMLNYAHAILTGALSNPGAYRRVPMIGGHLALAAILMGRFTQLKPESMASIKVYYKQIWDLFYLEYALYTLI